MAKFKALKDIKIKYNDETGFYIPVPTILNAGEAWVKKDEVIEGELDEKGFIHSNGDVYKADEFKKVTNIVPYIFGAIIIGAIAYGVYRISKGKNE